MSAEGARQLILTSEARLWRTPDGGHWGAMPFGYDTWMRYLKVFDQMTLVARVVPCAEPTQGSVRVDGPEVRVYGMTPFSGPKGFAAALPRLMMELRDGIPADASLLLRVPSPIGGLALRCARAGRPYGVEVVGDPYDVLAPGVVQHPLRPVLRYTGASQLRRQCRAAAVAIYVTRNALQRRYPVGAAGRAFVASNVMLDGAAFAADRQTVPRVGKPFRVVTVGSLAQRYKGVDVLLYALSGLAALGPQVDLDVVGAGQYLPELRAQAVRLGLGEHVTFHGELSQQGVRAVLDGADLFVLASRTEGLPRALLEAMARSLPCVGTKVGGVPELLPEECLAPPGDPVALRNRILDILRTRDGLAVQGRRNYEVARTYRAEVLQAVREAGYSRLLEITARHDAMALR